MATTIATMTERQLLDSVIELAELLKWRCVHFRPGMNRRGVWSTAMAGTQSAGWPDLLMARERLVVVELKSAKGRTTPHQLDWLACLANAGIEVYVWRPEDWESGEIEKTLRTQKPPTEGK
jgi:hypothetical protein